MSIETSGLRARAEPLAAYRASMPPPAARRCAGRAAVVGPDDVVRSSEDTASSFLPAHDSRCQIHLLHPGCKPLLGAAACAAAPFLDSIGEGRSNISTAAFFGAAAGASAPPVLSRKLKAEPARRSGRFGLRLWLCGRGTRVEKSKGRSLCGWGRRRDSRVLGRAPTPEHRHPTESQTRWIVMPGPG